MIALDTPIGDKDAADSTFATDNFEAGVLIGKWAKAQMGDAAKDAKIGMLNINKDNISVDVLRDTGFLTGFGIEVPNPKVLGSETDPRVDRPRDLERQSRRRPQGDGKPPRQGART